MSNNIEYNYVQHLKERDEKIHKLFENLSNKQNWKNLSQETNLYQKFLLIKQIIYSTYIENDLTSEEMLEFINQMFNKNKIIEEFERGTNYLELRYKDVFSQENVPFEKVLKFKHVLVTNDIENNKIILYRIMFNLPVKYKKENINNQSRQKATANPKNTRNQNSNASNNQNIQNNGRNQNYSNGYNNANNLNNQNMFQQNQQQRANTQNNSTNLNYQNNMNNQRNQNYSNNRNYSNQQIQQNNQNNQNRQNSFNNQIYQNNQSNLNNQNFQNYQNNQNMQNRKPLISDSANEKQIRLIFKLLKQIQNKESAYSYIKNNMHINDSNELKTNLSIEQAETLTRELEKIVKNEKFQSLKQQHGMNTQQIKDLSEKVEKENNEKKLTGNDTETLDDLEELPELNNLKNLNSSNSSNSSNNSNDQNVNTENETNVSIPMNGGIEVIEEGVIDLTR